MKTEGNTGNIELAIGDIVEVLIVKINYVGMMKMSVLLNEMDKLGIKNI